MSHLVENLLAALEIGALTKFGDLSSDEICALHDEFSAVPFTEEQRQILASLVFDASGQMGAIAAYNSEAQYKLGTFALVDGTLAIPVSVITNALPGEYYAEAYDFLISLPVRQITAADIPVPAAE